MSGEMKSRFCRQGLFGMGLIALGLLVLVGLAALPFLWQQSLQPELEEGRRMLALVEQKIKEAEKNKKPSAVTEANAPEAFVEGATAGLATASLQRAMLDKAGEAGMRVLKVQPLPAEAVNGLARLRLDMEISGSLESLRSYLLAVEAGAPLVFVREIHVATPTEAEEGDSQYPSENLTVNLQVEAFSWWGTPS
jgi:type II secretory pathway component PulM